MEAEFNLKVSEIPRMAIKKFYPDGYLVPEIKAVLNPKLTGGAIIEPDDELWGRKLFELDEQIPQCYFFEFEDKNISEVCDQSGVKVKNVQGIMKVDFFEVLFRQYEVGYSVLKQWEKKDTPSDLLVLDLQDVKGMCELELELDHFVSDSIFGGKYDLFGFISEFGRGRCFATVRRPSKDDKKQSEWFTFLSNTVCKDSWKDMLKQSRYLVYKLKDIENWMFR